MNTPHWTCDACGQRIVRARDGWISVVKVRARAQLRLVHQHAASPWTAWGGCESPEEEASLHLSTALREPSALRELAELEELDANTLARFRARLAYRTKNTTRFTQRVQP